MFRELTRIKQKLSQEESIDLLKQQPRGVLSLIGDDGYPYGVPIDHWYNEADGKIYFHSGREGHKVDAVRRCNKASFCVCDEGVRKEGDWALHIRSVIVFGRIEILDDAALIADVSAKLSRKFTQDEEYIAETRLQRALVKSVTPAAALAYMVFILLYFPCIATFVAIRNESGGWKWAILTAIYTIILAWIMAFATFQIASLFFSSF